MTKVALFQGKSRASVGAGGTQNIAAFNTNMQTNNDNIYIARTAGVFSGLYVRVISNDRAASTYKFRINGADGTQTVGSITGTGEFEDASGTDTVSAGDKINTRLVVGTGGTSFIFTVGRIVFTPTTGTVHRIGGTDHDQVTGASTRYYYPFGGRIAVASTTESEALMNVAIPGTYKNLGFNVTANTRTDTSTLGIRLNGADSSLKQTVATTQTGYFEDTSNTVPVTIGDTTCMFILTGAGTGNFRVAQGFQMEHDTPSLHFQTFAGQSGSGTSFLINVTNYIAFGGALTGAITTESEMQTKAPFSFTASGLQVRVPTNTITNDGTFRLRVNGANVNQTVPITGSTTGLFRDTTNVGDYIFAGDQINYQFVTGTAGTSTVVTGVSMLCATSVARGFMDF